MGLVLATLFFIATGLATLAFWYEVVTSELLIVNDSELYFIRNIGLIGLMIGALALFVTIGTFRRAALPIADLMEAIERAAGGDLNIQVEERGPREIRALTRAFNEMLAQWRLREEDQRRLSAEIARELQTRASGLDSPARQRDLAQLIEDWHTLTLAATNALVLDREPTDVAALVREVLTALHPTASECGVALRAEIADPAPVGQIDRARLAEVLNKLLLHALSRTAPGGTVDVQLAEERKPHRVEIAVTDHGRVLSPAELQDLFTRRGHTAPLGTGLELPLAARLVQAQGGEISAASDDENGTTIAFVLSLD